MNVPNTSQTCRYCGKPTESLGIVFHQDCADYLRSQVKTEDSRDIDLTDICLTVLREEKQRLWEQLWEVDCHGHWGKTLTGEFRHYCMDLDGLPLDETCDAVFPHCHCYEASDSKDRVLALQAEAEARMKALEAEHG